MEATAAFEAKDVAGRLDLGAGTGGRRGQMQRAVCERGTEGVSWLDGAHVYEEG